MSTSPLPIEPLLEKIDHLIDTMVHVEMDLSIAPTKRHLITNIKYQGMNQMRQEFIDALAASVNRYVLSKNQYKNRLDELINVEGIDEREASAILYQEARSYFRKSDTKGQFAELLLYNLLQYHLRALPVVRKMTITTNTELERHGADAIHLGMTDSGENCVFLGEAKTYTSGFLSAFKKGIKSVITAYNEHRNELQLYKYENVIPEVRTIIRKYLNGKLDLPVKLVVIICYCSDKTPSFLSKEEYHNYYVEQVLNSCKSIKDTHYIDIDNNPIKPSLLKELHYIMFPINELEKLLSDFQRKIGVK